MANQAVSKRITAICGESQRDGVIRVYEFTRNERIKRAWKTFGLCLLALAVCACIPGAHLVLVPLMVLVMPWLVWRTWKTPSTIEALEIVCAQCHGELTRVTSREGYPFFENCTACRRENRIVLETFSATSSTNP